MRSFASALALSFASHAIGAPVQWPAGSGGNNHYYERVDQINLTFAAAKNAAAARSFAGLPGRLLILETANYSAELNFVFDNVYAPGVVSERMYWAGAILPAATNTWAWIDGSSIPASPGWSVDHFEGPGDEGGGFFRTSSRTLWDYIVTNSSNLVSGYIVEYAGATCPGDFNGDGLVDDADFSIFIVSYNALVIPPANPICDLNSDDLVDDADFSIFAVAYNNLLCP
ncbi:MAG: hypothetical protein ACREJD_05550 [Phycisphaerales bacterium]